MSREGGREEEELLLLFRLNFSSFLRAVTADGRKTAAARANLPAERAAGEAPPAWASFTATMFEPKRAAPRLIASMPRTAGGIAGKEKSGGDDGDDDDEEGDEEAAAAAEVEGAASPEEEEEGSTGSDTAASSAGSAEASRGVLPTPLGGKLGTTGGRRSGSLLLLLPPPPTTTTVEVDVEGEEEADEGEAEVSLPLAAALRVRIRCAFHRRPVLALDSNAGRSSARESLVLWGASVGRGAVGRHRGRSLDIFSLCKIETKCKKNQNPKSEKRGKKIKRTRKLSLSLSLFLAMPPSSAASAAAAAALLLRRSSSRLPFSSTLIARDGGATASASGRCIGVAGRSFSHHLRQPLPTAAAVESTVAPLQRLRLDVVNMSPRGFAGSRPFSSSIAVEASSSSPASSASPPSSQSSEPSASFVRLNNIFPSPGSKSQVRRTNV